jgi:hypothetical protein
MRNFIDELQAEAGDAVEAMKTAALRARCVHACAELMRHMLLTARKVRTLPRDTAVATVVREWMTAWHLDDDAYPEVASEMRVFTAAFCAFAEAESDEADLALRQAAGALEDALGRAGTTLADQMAWRSECAHGWWELVAPTPEDLPGRTERSAIPGVRKGQAFWEAGCASHCRG